MARSFAFRKSDLTPAFEAAKKAGWEQVSVTVETADGHRFHITAGKADTAAQSDLTPLQKWKANRA